ncbi:ImmA/IrrE family metallo-endopeptidase [archaeon]|nr:ImmA/IrrE family metallo-endopeptidase [Nanoarchaeota archaeon]MCG2723886.1 ImmA/IrrE family metallo-endopeptidase [archaeon]
MPRKEPIAVNVEPAVLKWLIGSSGWNREELAKRLKTNLQNIEKFESGEKKPTLRQLEELSAIFKRPLAAFLLSEPIAEKPKPKDYRMLPDKVDKFDKKTILVMRKARRLQDLSKELSINIKYETKSKLPKINVSEDPEKIALNFRKRFNLSEEKQRKFKTPYELFHYLRDVFEDLNIFVFQFSMPVEDARGFVFVDESPNVIVVNTKDNIEARIFSLMHEFAHILLGESVIDLPDATYSYKDNVEKWCNEFAASFLLPKDLAKTAFETYKSNLTQKETLKYLSNKYKVSKAMLLLNMLKLKYIERTDYDAILARFKKEEIKPKKEPEKGTGGGVPSEVRCLSEVGNKFVSLVANNYDKSHITYTDALNYLSIKSKSFDKVLSKAKK